MASKGVQGGAQHSQTFQMGQNHDEDEGVRDSGREAQNIAETSSRSPKLLI